MKTLYALLWMSAFVLASCASLQQDWIVQNCQHEAAYEKGMNDARGQAPMNSGYVQSCPMDRQEVTLTGYHEGYDAGLRTLQQAAPAGPPALINVNVGGAPAPMYNPRAWYCKMHAFNDEFESFGPTELEATHHVTDECRRKFDPMFCKESQCRLNQ